MRLYDRPASRGGMQGFEVVREYAPGDEVVLTWFHDQATARRFIRARPRPVIERPYLPPAERQKRRGRTT